MCTKTNYEIKKRQELQNYSEVVVKVSEKELKWLVPFGEKSKGKIKPMPLEQKDFTIKAVGNEWESIFAVHEECLGKIRVYGYTPINYKNKRKSIHGEEPYFSVTLQFALGTVNCVNFEGNNQSRKKAEICNAVLYEVVPIILYMQEYASYASVIEKKISIKTEKQKRTIIQRTYKPRRFENPIPENHMFMGENVKIEKPQFMNIDDNKEGIIAIIESTDDTRWLQFFSEDIRRANRKAVKIGQKIKYPFYDETKIHNISAIRIYEDKEKDENSFMQLQIHNTGNKIYQIDYFDVELIDECKMIIVADISKDPAMFDIAYVGGDGEVTSVIEDYASRMVTALMDTMTYLRPYQQNGEKEIVTITEIPKMF